MHYPWLFNSAIFDKLVIGTTNEQSYRSEVNAITKSLDDDDAQVCLDSYIRTCAFEAWNHRTVFEETKVLASMQLVRAEASQYFFTTWKRLSTGLTEPFSNALHSYIEQQKSFLDQELEQHHIKSIIGLFSSYCQQREEEWKRQASGFTTANLSIRSRYFKRLALDSRVSERHRTPRAVLNPNSGKADPIADT